MSAPRALNLAELREKAAERAERPPYEHQVEAFAALSKLFDLKAAKGKGALLVLPTGAGKTLTAVRWLFENVIPKNIRVLWMAQSYNLLDQAFQAMRENAHLISARRQLLGVRLISSSPSHDPPSDIENTDDIVVITVPTAIRNLNPVAQDTAAQPITRNFRKWIDASASNGLFIVLDEAHHAPAYGCRNLLVGTADTRIGIRRLLPQANLLGLTATPTYTDETRRGWLGKIFESGIAYQAEKSKLTMLGILSEPKYLQVQTGKEWNLNDQQYDSIMREHKDLPEDLIDRLAKDQPRNDLIVNHYLQQREKYGKTIIFADRWQQCVYLKEKLVQRGVRADAVYSRVDSDPGSAEARNLRTANTNEIILSRFKNNTGPESLEVLINIRMLTEGADVPAVRTVFLTRSTTSTILFQQMIGRALRGKRAGGGDSANIVMFCDKWRQHIDWATSASLDGGTEDDKPKLFGYDPYELISIHLVEELARRMTSVGDSEPIPFSQIMPLGWFMTECTVSTSDDPNEPMQAFSKVVMVYDETKEKYDRFIDKFLANPPDGWAHEFLTADWMNPRVEQWIDQFFDREKDDFGNSLAVDLIHVARHLAQKGCRPRFHSFEERSQYDLEPIVRKRFNYSQFDNFKYIREELYYKPGTLWKTFYRTPEQLAAAFDAEGRRLATISLHGEAVAEPMPDRKPRRPRELTESEKEQVKRRDGKQCLCCGASGPYQRLQVDHIRPYSQGGDSTIENSQSLCRVCNDAKGEDIMNFLRTESDVRTVQELPNPVVVEGEELGRAMSRMINRFYRCRALCDFKFHQRSHGKYYSTWRIELYTGCDPALLQKQKIALLEFVHLDLGKSHVTDFEIVCGKSG